LQLWPGGIRIVHENGWNGVRLKPKSLAIRFGAWSEIVEEVALTKMQLANAGVVGIPASIFTANGRYPLCAEFTFRRESEDMFLARRVLSSLHHLLFSLSGPVA